jgi:iron-sulfur cluster assembly protein
MSVTVTDTAAREIDTIIRQQELDPTNVRLRVGVKGGGCSGFSYLLDLTEVQKESDESWSVPFAIKENGEERSGEITVVCDPKSYLYLNGTTIDFKDELMGRGFVFNNPNATNTCGCGSSFSA